MINNPTTTTTTPPDSGTPTTHMAILQEIDKCMKCRACQVACQRVHGLHRVPAFDGVPKIEWDDPVLVTSQTTNDIPPFVRYSCWHCINPMCASRCPLKAIKVHSNGAVYVDDAICNPQNPLCKRQCRNACRRGGYPQIRDAQQVVGDEQPLMIKCDLCYSRKAPACVEACPAGALSFGDKTDIAAKATAYPYTAGDGHIYWASNTSFTTPLLTPELGGKISMMMASVVDGPAAKALLLPGLLVSGVYALYRKRLEVAAEKEKA